MNESETTVITGGSVIGILLASFANAVKRFALAVALWIAGYALQHVGDAVHSLDWETTSRVILVAGNLAQVCSIAYAFGFAIGLAAFGVLALQIGIGILRAEDMKRHVDNDASEKFKHALDEYRKSMVAKSRCDVEKNPRGED